MWPHSDPKAKTACWLTLKLSPYFLIEDKDRRPIVVLDDVLSELDPPTQDRLILPSLTNSSKCS
jgi:recombinational DNA repair ATPase RecF